VTWWPRRSSCQAVARPTMPAPSTHTCMKATFREWRQTRDCLRL